VLLGCLLLRLLLLLHSRLLLPQLLSSTAQLLRCLPLAGQLGGLLRLLLGCQLRLLLGSQLCLLLGSQLQLLLCSQLLGCQLGRLIAARVLAKGGAAKGEPAWCRECTCITRGEGVCPRGAGCPRWGACPQIMPLRCPKPSQTRC
jgi:hypothetical protein